MKIVAPPLNDKIVMSLKAGDEVLITGAVYGARDAAHKRMLAELEQGKGFPFLLEGQIIYYVGPCPAPPGKAIGSAGPTTSGRMDSYTPILLAFGLKGMIGKGQRRQEVVDAMIEHKAVYFAAVGGAGAYLSKTVTKVEYVAYKELGPEALVKMELVRFPCFVAIDARGNSLYS